LTGDFEHQYGRETVGTDYIERYWQEAFECCVDELGKFEHFTTEECAKAGKTLAMSAEMQSMAFGWEEADKSVRRMQREEHESAVFDWVQRKMEEALYGSPRVLEFMSYEQKMALGSLQDIRRAFERDRPKKVTTPGAKL